MEKLIVRLERASAPSWDLDSAIARLDDIREAFGDCADNEVPAYTSSIDAALTLVPEGWRWQVGEFNVNPGATADLAEVGQIMNFGIGIKHRAQAKAVNAPIAICIAALKARSVPQRMTEDELLRGLQDLIPRNPLGA